MKNAGSFALPAVLSALVQGGKLWYNHTDFT